MNFVVQTREKYKNTQMEGKAYQRIIRTEDTSVEQSCSVRHGFIPWHERKVHVLHQRGVSMGKSGLHKDGDRTSEVDGGQQDKESIKYKCRPNNGTLGMIQ